MCERVIATRVVTLASGARTRLWRCTCQQETNWKLIDLPFITDEEDDDPEAIEARWAKHEAQLAAAIADFDDSFIRGDARGRVKS